MKQNLLLLCALLFWGTAFAQNQSSVQLKGVYHQGKVLLRWGPADFPTWQKGNTLGYKLERIQLTSGGVAQSAAQVNASLLVLDSLIKPAPESLFISMSDTLNAAGIAAAALYQESFDVEPMSGGDDLARALNANSQQENRYGFGLLAADGSFAVASAMALGYSDQNNVQAGESYLYRLYQHTQANGQNPVLIGAITLSTANEYQAPAPPLPQTEVKGQQILLSWSRTGLEQHYTTYMVERSTDAGNTWTKANNSPLLSPEREGNKPDLVFFGDQLPATGNVQYRVRGITPFGFAGTPSASVAASKQGVQRSERPFVYKITEVNQGTLSLFWEFPDSLNAQIQRIEVRRSSAPEGPFTLLPSGTLSNTARSFEDASPLSSNYYQVVAIHQDNYEMSAVPALGQIADETPPGVPAGLKGSISNGGTVDLSWTVNADLDVRGYRVFKSNSADGTFSEVSQGVIAGVAFSHRIEMQTLSKSIFYRISAVDFHENESAMGTVLELKRPDVVPPAEPLVLKVQPSNAGISIEWQPSSSEDVVKHVIERKPSAGSAWESAWVQNGALSSAQTWQDTNLATVAEWDYRVIAYDEAGLYSSSKPAKGKSTAVKRPGPSNGKAEISTSDNQLAVKLLWQYPENIKPMDMLIYRARDNASLTLYSVLPLEENPPVTTLAGQQALYVYKDKEVNPGSDYKYQIIMRFSDGVRSAATPEIPVSLK